jgi:DNA-binding response OmpR family regulator
MVYGVVNQSGGSIFVYSEPGRGTTFKIYLPRVDDAPTVEGGKADVAISQGSETVLLVEDEEPLRELVASLLTDNGYTVLQAPNGKVAIELAKENSYIDLLMTDVVMPGLSGSELAEIIEVFIPDLKLLYMSGYTSDLITHHGVLDSGVKLLEKPFTKNSLLSTVRMVLESPSDKQS